MALLRLKDPSGPAFRAFVEPVIDLYHRLWEGQPLGPDEYVLSADEKTCIQTPRRTRPTRAPSPGHPIRVEPQYARGEIVTYLAALDPGRGKVFGDRPEANNKAAFYRFVDAVLAREPYRSAARVFWILDHAIGTERDLERGLDRTRGGPLHS